MQSPIWDKKGIASTENSTKDSLQWPNAGGKSKLTITQFVGKLNEEALCPHIETNNSLNEKQKTKRKGT